jgi:hypothetical protein
MPGSISETGMFRQLADEVDYTLAVVYDDAHIRISNVTTDVRLEWLGFDGDDCFSDFHIDVASEEGTRQFRFGPCAVHGLRKLSRFFRDGSQASVSLGFQQPDIRCCDFVRADEGYRLLVRFEGSGLSEQFFLRTPSVQIDDGLLSAYLV